MKYLFIFFIGIYQLFFSPIFRQIVGVGVVCRYPVSCSEYAKRKIRQYGLTTGIKLGIERLLSCR